MRIQTKHFRERKIKGGNCLIVVAGNIACGKSTLCKRLSKDLNIPFVEINNQYDEYSNNVILESTGLGYRTSNIRTYFKKSFTIKCHVDRNQAFENIKTRKKVFKPHEIKLGLNQFDFFDYCASDLQKLRADVIYDYRKDNYAELLDKCRFYVQEGGDK